MKAGGDAANVGVNVAKRPNMSHIECNLLGARSQIRFVGQRHCHLIVEASVKYPLLTHTYPYQIRTFTKTHTPLE